MAESPRAEQFLRAGLEVLAADGSDGLTIASLCQRLRITKGSFYHHFDGMPGYTEALLNYWESECNYRPIAKSRQSNDARHQVESLTRWSVDLPHLTEAAIRSWGKSNPRVAQAQARVDAARQRRIFEVVSAVGLPEEKAAFFANLNISILIGFQHRVPHQDPQRLMEMFEQVNEYIYLAALEANESSGAPVS